MEKCVKRSPESALTMAAGKEQRKRRKNNMQKFITNIFNEAAQVESQYTIEWTRQCDTWTANFYNVRNENGRCTLSVMRSVSAHWALGGELLLEWNEPQKLTPDLALAAR